MILRQLIALVFWSLSFSQAVADGFSLTFALETSPHVIVRLTPEQVIEVGRTRRLVLTEEQKNNLGYNLKNVPDVFGVESLGEPDCSCCISPAMWTDRDRVTIWIEKYSSKKDMSEYYRTVRLKERHFVMDSEGRVFHKGTEISLDRFREIANTGEYGVHLAMPPICPPDIKKQIDELKSKGRVSSRL